ncbi:hypothetical protein [uncultured Bifidobacterium sp.]|nr:hypothetical protein [uncultured Bifidobacterium sp.]
MIDLLHADCYRLIHGRKFWVGCVVLILCSVGLLAGVITFISGYDGSVDADITAVLTRTLPSHSAMLTYSSMFRGGLVSGVVSLVVALAVSEDRDSGLAKNIFSSGVGRGRYAVEKLLLATLLSLWYALLSIVTLEITFAALRFDYASAEPVIGWLGFVVVLVLGVAVYATIAAMAALVTGSGVFSSVVAVGAGFQLVGGALTGLAGMVPQIGWLQRLVAWLPISNMNMLTDARSMMAETLPEAARSFLTGTADLGMPVWAHATVCFVGWLALCWAVTLLVVCRRDPC